VQNDAPAFVLSGKVDGWHGANALPIQDDVLGADTIPATETE